ncbi:signal recognition particle 19 kDa protein isoform X1 [Nymphaea colorata]|nr:signal recognition particle 19 kDa protein isoform X1 [Nymphaea colorata]
MGQVGSDFFPWIIFSAVQVPNRKKSKFFAQAFACFLCSSARVSSSSAPAFLASPSSSGSFRSMMAVAPPNTKRWIILYPVYMNSKKTLAEGRRICTSKACENPTCAEIVDCCAHLKVPCVFEVDKAYPRDFMQVGRVRVSLKKEDGSFYNPEICSRKQLMLQVAELVPRHPGRSKKQEPAASTAAASSKPSKGGKKKK